MCPGQATTLPDRRFGSRKAHIASAQLHYTVWQFQRLQNVLGVANHRLQRFVGLLGVNNLHHFNFVELVLTDHTACITATTTRFRTETRRVSRQAHRQGVTSQNLVTHHTGQADLGGGDQVQVFRFGLCGISGLVLLATFGDPEHIVLELGQLAGAIQRGRVHDVGV